jgi:hypothetical protein
MDHRNVAETCCPATGRPEPASTTRPRIVKRDGAAPSTESRGRSASVEAAGSELDPAGVESAGLSFRVGSDSIREPSPAPASSGSLHVCRAIE